MSARCEECGVVHDKRSRSGTWQRFCSTKCLRAAVKRGNHQVIQASTLRRAYYVSGRGGTSSREK